MGELIDLAQRRELVDFIRRLATEIAAECADDGLVIDREVQMRMRFFILARVVDRFGSAA